MKKFLIAAAMTLMCSSAFAQNSTGPAPQSDNMQKNGSMDNGTMKNGSMGSTSGMNNGMNNGMSKEKMPKTGGMKKDDMAK
jgi:pentapeptide MXKDX repeat protein